MAPAPIVVTLRCERCRARIATVRDTRFGMAPAASLCRACSARS